MLNVACALGSLAMNLLAANLTSPRSITVWVLPSALYALASDRLIAVVRRWVQASDPAARTGPEGSAWRAAGGLALWALRLIFDLRGTLAGFRHWVLAVAPVAPGIRAVTRPAADKPPALPTVVGGEMGDGLERGAEPGPASPPVQPEPHGQAGSPLRDAAAHQRLARGETKRAALIRLYERSGETGDPRYGDRAKAAALASEIAGRIGYHPGTARRELAKYLAAQPPARRRPLTRNRTRCGGGGLMHHHRPPRHLRHPGGTHHRHHRAGQQRQDHGGRLRHHPAGPPIHHAAEWLVHHRTGLLIALGVLLLLALAVRLVIGNPRAARHRVRMLRWRIRLYLRPGPGYANILELAVRWSRLRAVRIGRRSRPSLPWWARLILPVTFYAVRLGRAHLGRRVIAGMEDQALVIAAPRQGKSGWLADRIIDHPGAAMTTSTRTDLYVNTAALRGRRGVLHVFNPEGIGGLPSTFRWNPVAGCDQPAVALQRAASFTAATESRGLHDMAFWIGKASSVLASLLHAAALDGRTMNDVYQWAHGTDDARPSRSSPPTPAPPKDGSARSANCAGPAGPLIRSG